MKNFLLIILVFFSFSKIQSQTIQHEFSLNAGLQFSQVNELAYLSNAFAPASYIQGEFLIRIKKISIGFGTSLSINDGMNTLGFNEINNYKYSEFSLSAQRTMFSGYGKLGYSLGQFGKFEPGFGLALGTGISFYSENKYECMEEGEIYEYLHRASDGVHVYIAPSASLKYHINKHFAIGGQIGFQGIVNPLIVGKITSKPELSYDLDIYNNRYSTSTVTLGFYYLH